MKRSLDWEIASEIEYMLNFAASNDESDAEQPALKKSKTDSKDLINEIDRLKDFLQSDKPAPAPVLETCRVAPTHLDENYASMGDDFLSSDRQTKGKVTHSLWLSHPAFNDPVRYNLKAKRLVSFSMENAKQQFMLQHHEAGLLLPIRAASYRLTRPLISAAGTNAGIMLMTPFCFVWDAVLQSQLLEHQVGRELVAELGNKRRGAKYNWRPVSPEFLFAEHVRRFLFDDGGIYKRVDGASAAATGRSETFEKSMRLIYEVIGDPQGRKQDFTTCRCAQVPHRAGRPTPPAAAGDQKQTAPPTPPSSSHTQMEDRLREHCNLLEQTLRNLAIRTAGMHFELGTDTKDMRTQSAREAADLKYNQARDELGKARDAEARAKDDQPILHQFLNPNLPSKALLDAAANVAKASATYANAVDANVDHVYWDAVGRFVMPTGSTPTTTTTTKRAVVPVLDAQGRNPWLKPLSEDTDINLIPLTLLVHILNLYDEAHQLEGVVGESTNAHPPFELRPGGDSLRRRLLREMISVHLFRVEGRYFWTFNMEERVSPEFLRFNKDEWFRGGADDAVQRTATVFADPRKMDDEQKYIALASASLSKDTPHIYFHTRQRLSFVLNPENGKPMTPLDEESMNLLLPKLLQREANKPLSLSPWIEAQLDKRSRSSGDGKRSGDGGKGGGKEGGKGEKKLSANSLLFNLFIVANELTDLGFRTFVYVYFKAVAKAYDAKFATDEYSKLISHIRMTSPMPIQAAAAAQASREQKSHRPEEGPSLLGMLHDSARVLLDNQAGDHKLLLKWDNDRWDYRTRSKAIRVSVTQDQLPGWAAGEYTLEDLERAQRQDDITKGILTELLRQLVPEDHERQRIRDLIFNRVLAVDDAMERNSLEEQLLAALHRFESSERVAQAVDAKQVQEEQVRDQVNAVEGQNLYEQVMFYWEMHRKATWPPAQLYQETMRRDLAQFRPIMNVIYHLRNGTPLIEQYWYLPDRALYPKRVPVDMEEVVLVIPLHKSFGTSYEQRGRKDNMLGGHYLSCICQRYKTAAAGSGEQKGGGGGGGGGGEQRMYDGRVIVWDPLSMYDSNVQQALEPALRKFLPRFQIIFVDKRRIQATQTVDCGFFLIWTLKQFLESLIPELNKRGMKGIVDEPGQLVSDVFSYGFDHVQNDLNVSQLMYTLDNKQADINLQHQQTNRNTMVYFRQQLEAAYDAFNPDASSDVQEGIEARVLQSEMLASPF